MKNFIMSKKYIVSLLEEGKDKKLSTNTLELTDRELNDMMSRAGFYLDKEFGYTDHTDYFQYRMVFRSSIRHTNCLITMIREEKAAKILYAYGTVYSMYADTDFTNKLNKLWKEKHSKKTAAVC